MEVCEVKLELGRVIQRLGSEITSKAVTRFSNNQFGQYKTWTADCGLGIKYGLGIKCGLRTEYKTRTGCKTRTTDYVNKNSFRKVKLREMESRLAKTVVPALTFPWLFT